MTHLPLSNSGRSNARHLRSFDGSANLIWGITDPSYIANPANLLAYIEGFSENVREIFIKPFKLPEQIAKLDIISKEAA